MTADSVYVGSDDDRPYALNADDGSPRWRPRADDDVVSSPAVLDGIVFVLDVGSRRYAIEADE